MKGMKKKFLIAFSSVMILGLMLSNASSAFAENNLDNAAVNETEVKNLDEEETTSSEDEKNVVEKEEIKTQEVKTTNDNTRNGTLYATGLPINSTFSVDGVNYKVIAEGEVSIVDSTGFVSQSTEPGVMQIDTVDKDGFTYKITQLEHIDMRGYHTLVANNVNTLENQPNGNWDIEGFKIVLPNLTWVDRDGLKNLAIGINAIQMDALSILGYPPYQGKSQREIFMDCKNLKEASFAKWEDIGIECFRGLTLLETISAPNATRVGYKSFFGCIKLKNVDVPEAVELDREAFAMITSAQENDSDNYPSGSLTDVSFPKLRDTGNASGAFRNQRNLKSFSAPNLEKIGAYCFKYAGDLTSGLEVYAPNVKTIEVGAFTKSAIKEANFPEVTYLEGSAFKNAAMLEIATFDKLSTLEGGTFMGSSIKEVNLPKVETIESVPNANHGAFQDCTELSKVNMPLIKTIGKDAFRINSTLGATGKFDSLTLGNTPPPTVIEGENVFLNQPTQRYLYVTDKKPYLAVNDGDTTDNLWYGWTVRQECTIEAEVVGGHGTVTPASQTVYEGTDVEFTVTPDKDYIIDTITSAVGPISVVSENIEVKGNTITVKNFTSSMKITITMRLVTHNPDGSVTVPGVDGTIGNADDVIVKPGTDGKLPTVNADGSVNVPNGGTVVLPDGSVVTPPSGSIVLPDGTIVTPGAGDKDGAIINPDGSVTVPGVDGTIGNADDVTVKPGTEGKLPTINADGSVNVPNGGTVVLPDGSVVTPPNGSIVLPDGTIVTPGTGDKDGAIINPDGSVTVPGVDGTIGNADDVTVKPGTEGKLPTINADGSVNVPNGGTVVLPDGSVVTPPSGSIVLPDGTIVTPGTGDKDGTTVTPENLDKPAAPETSDTTQASLYIAFLLLATTGMAIIIIKKRRLVVKNKD